MEQEVILHEQLHSLQRIDVVANETLNFFFVLFGTEPIERRVVFTLADGSRVNVKGLVLGSEQAEINLTTEVIHAGCGTEGFTTVKGLLGGNAHATVTGWIRIPESGHNTNAFLEERFMLLSKGARAKAEPMLEILANDVKASHAATVSRLNDDQLFYCESRGIDPAESKRLLTEAFMNDIIRMIPDESIVAQCAGYLARSLLSNSREPRTRA
ncbi:SufD family Fe-S cluster assembly protein [Candidatus Uhrbacteria bacterium]|nr:SufD family Fe-S cluster assembly protein [Candidatus Uhrbacteria bacterium]